jgi:hypothetical protein
MGYARAVRLVPHLVPHRGMRRCNCSPPRRERDQRLASVDALTRAGFEPPCRSKLRVLLARATNYSLPPGGEFSRLAAIHLWLVLAWLRPVKKSLELFELFRHERPPWFDRLRGVSTPRSCRAEGSRHSQQDKSNGARLRAGDMSANNSLRPASIRTYAHLIQQGRRVHGVRSRCLADIAVHDRGRSPGRKATIGRNGGNRRDNAAARGVANGREANLGKRDVAGFGACHSSGSPAFRTPSNTAGQFGICSIIDLTVNFGFRRRASAKKALASSILPASA